MNINSYNLLCSCDIYGALFIAVKEDLLIYSTHDLEDIYLDSRGPSENFKSNKKSLKAKHTFDSEILGLQLSSTAKYIAVIMGYRIEIFEAIILLHENMGIASTIVHNISSLSLNFCMNWNKCNVCGKERYMHEERFLLLHDSSLLSYKYDDKSCNFAVAASIKSNYSAADWGVGICSSKIVVTNGICLLILGGDTLNILESYTLNQYVKDLSVNYLNWFYNGIEENRSDENQILVGLKAGIVSTINILVLTETDCSQYKLPADVDICRASHNLFPSNVRQEYQKFYCHYLSDMGLLMIMSNVSSGCALLRLSSEDWEWELFSANVSLRLPKMKSDDNYLDTYTLGSCIVNCSKNTYFDTESGEEWDPRPLIGGKTSIACK